VAQAPERGRRRRFARLRADDTLARKASLNVAASFLDYTARIVVGLLVNPVLVSRLGDFAFGVYQVLGRLVAYSTPAGGRPSQALKWTIARDQHSEAYDEKRIQVGSAIAVWLLFLPLLAVCGGALAWFAPLLLDVPESLHLTVRVAAALLVLDLIVTNLLTIPQSVVQGENLGYKRMGLSVVVVVAGGVLMAVVVLLGGGLVGVAAAVVATTVMSGLLYLWVARRHVHWFGVSRPPFRAIGWFVRLSAWFLLWNLVMQLMRGSDVVVLGIAASAELVTVYTLSRYVPEAIFSAVAIAISAVMPGLGGLIGARQTGRAGAVRSESMAFTWLLATSAGAAFVVWQESFLTLWVGERYYPGVTETVLIVLLVIQFAFIRNDASIIDLTLDLRAKVTLGFLSALLAIALAVVLVSVFELGITGLAVGFLAGRSLLSVAYPWLVCRALGLPLRGQVRGALRPIVVAAGLLAAAAAVAPSAEVDAWLPFLGASVATLAVLGVTSFFAGLSRSQRARVWGRARQVAARP